MPTRNDAFDDSTIFDYASFRRRMLNDDNIITELIAEILDQMPKMIAELRGYVEQKEILQAGRQAHTIKGAAANLGCERFRKAALGMESAAEENGWETLASLLPVLEDEWKRADLLLRKTIA